MPRFFFLSMGFLIAFGVGLAWFEASGRLGSDSGSVWVDPDAEAEEPVLVLLVGSRNDLAAVRRTVASERVVAESRDAFAVREGHVVATSPAAASDPLNDAGWAEREVRIWTPTRTPVAATPHGAAAPPVGRHAEARRLGELAKQETLSSRDASAALRLLEQGL